MKLKFLIDDKKVMAKLLTMRSEARNILRDAIEKSCIRVENTAKTPYLSGLALNVRTGRLRSSISHMIEETADSLIGYVGTNVVYGRAWELGFTRLGKSYAPRPFLKPALTDELQNIRSILQEAIRSLIRSK